MKPTTHPFRSQRLIASGALLLASLFSWQAQADDAVLYGPAAPKGSTFVRLYNASNQEVSANVGTAKLDDVGPLASTEFSFLPGGSYSAQVGSQSVSLQLGAGRYYTLVNLPNGQPRLVEEKPYRNKQKALLRVQNLSDTPLSLKTADGKTAVVENVAPQSYGDREINPVKVNLALFAGTQKVSDLKPVALDRGEVVCLFVTGSAGKLAPVWVKRPLAAN
ncbi:alginate O-acetyltransferase [Pseudomonas cavernae]|uniref:Alginate biosynthesis protein AlgF n=1 Tax=Pseudomonas cavernae TaxID=2320867 RepID=A0A385Z280_9PSED|nr:alginate O-acetyltransferase AlgF [Pseudomonas cavernae]AYC31868.1 alginate O-acetyltransferase [Pseudomonas cavernae]